MNLHWILNEICILKDNILDLDRNKIQVILITSIQLTSSQSFSPAKGLLTLSANTLPPEDLPVNLRQVFFFVFFLTVKKWSDVESLIIIIKHCLKSYGLRWHHLRLP